MVLIGVIIFYAIKNNELAKEISEYACETDIMEQDGLYNFIDSEGNMKTAFDYTDLSRGNYQYKKAWKKKYIDRG